MNEQSLELSLDSLKGTFEELNKELNKSIREVGFFANGIVGSATLFNVVELEEKIHKIRKIRKKIETVTGKIELLENLKDY